MAAHDNLSTDQFGPIIDREGWDGPTGSFGDPGAGIMGWQGLGVMPTTGSGI